MSELLQPITFAPELLAELSGFDCGDEPHQRELARWLLHESTDALGRGSKLWLYANGSNDIVGFGSLGETRWKYPDGDSPRRAVVIIPAVAIQRAYWGLPKGQPENRYSSQIMRHLLAEA